MGNKKTIYSKELMRKRSNEIIDQLKVMPMHGIERFIHRLETVPDDEEYLDILAQGRFALILNHNGFSGIELEPLDNGPDIRITSEVGTLYFEVKRRRHKEEDYELAESGGASWIRPDRDDNVISIIRNKLGQLRYGEINIVVIWSNTVMLGSPEIQEACKSISKEIFRNEGAYAKLSGIILVQDEKIDFTSPDNICLFINDQAARLLHEPLIVKLSSFCRCKYTIQQFSGYS